MARAHKVKVKKEVKRSIALSQIIILILGTMAISYIAGSEIGFVRGDVGSAGSCGLNYPNQVIPSTNSFCYGDSTSGYHKYTYTSPTTLIDDRGLTYTITGTTWTYSSRNGIQIPLPPQSTNAQGNTGAVQTFTSLAAQVGATGNVIPQSSQTPSTSAGLLTQLTGVESTISTAQGVVNTIQGAVNPAIAPGCTSDFPIRCTLTQYCPSAGGVPNTCCNVECLSTLPSTVINRPSGSPCESNPQCAGGNCDPILHVCRGNGGGTVPASTPTNLPSGATCTSSTQCLSRNCDFNAGTGTTGICIGSSTGGTATTTPPSTSGNGGVGTGTVTVGGSCNPTNSPSDCASGFQCTCSSGTCGTSANPSLGYTCQATQIGGTQGNNQQNNNEYSPDFILGNLLKTSDPVLYSLVEIPGHIIQGGVIALGISVVIAQVSGILEALGVPSSVMNALNPALSWGWFVGESTYGVANSIATLAGSTSAKAWGLGFGIGAGLVTAVLIFLLSQTNQNQETLTFSCLPWQAATGGQNCGLCGLQGTPCSQYQCESLGQGCQLLNAQSNGNQICVWVNKQDTKYPTIQPLSSVLPSGYSYSNSNAIAPPDTGVKLISSSSDGSIPPFTPLTVGIKTDVPSQCKIDSKRDDAYDNMTLFMDSGLYAYNHTFILDLPSPGVANQSGITLTPGIMNLFVRCQSANGYSTLANFVIQFNVSQIPDTSAPVILGASLPDNTPVASGINNTLVSIFINKPVSGCNWSHSDYSYQSMENSLDCSNAHTLNNMNSNGQFACVANLTGIKNGLTSVFYFRCNDTLGNVNIAEPPFTLHLIGTQPLVISTATPNQTAIIDSSTSVQVNLSVQTAAGANQGQAICYYTNQDPNQNPNSYQEFANTNSYQSTQSLWLTAANYTYNLKCVDSGGNAAYSSVNFSVQTITSPPNVIRVYHSGTNLNIQTDRNSTCVYDIVDCTYPFNQGIQMSTTDQITQSTAWVAGRTYYIKCEDTYGNQPAPNSCIPGGMIVTASET